MVIVEIENSENLHASSNAALFVQAEPHAPKPQEK